MEINAQPKGLTRLQKNGKDLNEDRKGGARDPNGNIEMTNKKKPCNPILIHTPVLDSVEGFKILIPMILWRPYTLNK